MKLTRRRMKWNGMWNGMSSCECGKLPNSFPTVTAKRYKMRRNKAKWLRACYILRQSAGIHLATHGCIYTYVWLYIPPDLYACLAVVSTRLPASFHTRTGRPSAIICLARMRLLVLAHNKIIYCIINNTRRSRNHFQAASPFPCLAEAAFQFRFAFCAINKKPVSPCPCLPQQLPRSANKGNKINKIKIKIYKSVAALLQQCVCDIEGVRAGAGSEEGEGCSVRGRWMGVTWVCCVWFYCLSIQSS